VAIALQRGYLAATQMQRIFQLPPIPGIFHGIGSAVGKANAISITYHDWGWFIAPIEMVFYFGWFMNYWVYGLPHDF
jgi:hypothetical protein